MLEIYDPLYGNIELPDFARDIINTPELQRLTEIRLMNVCGPTMIGATTISRFEHALGVAHLANIYSNKFCLNEIERNNLILGSLIHDVASFPYGHLVENIYKRLFPGSPDHTQRLLNNIFNQMEDLVIYRGFHCQLFKKIHDHRALFGRTARLSAQLILGVNILSNNIDTHSDDKLGYEAAEKINLLISGPIDLDNIDNVFRVAQRFGIKFNMSVPEKLATSFQVNGNRLIIHADDIWLLEEWLEVRSKIYNIFFTNHDILAMKSLLSYCVETCVKNDVLHEEDWTKTDIQFLETFLAQEDLKVESRQILLGHSLKCVKLYIIENGDLKGASKKADIIRDIIASKTKLLDTRKRKIDYATQLERLDGRRRVFVTTEYDNGATSRKVDLEISSLQNKRTSIGENSDRLFISIQMPDWCTLEDSNFDRIFAECIAKTINCSPEDVVSYKATSTRYFSNMSNTQMSFDI